MAIKTILVPVDGTDGARAAMETAFTVGRDLAAHVTVLHVSADARDALPLMGEGMSGAMIEDMLDRASDEIRERRERAADMFETFCKRYQVPVVEAPPAPAEVSAVFVTETGPEDLVVAKRGRLSDLVVASAPRDGAPLVANPTLNAALFESARPVLVAPESPPTVIGRHVVVAWNGGSESARAARTSFAFLAKAEKVTVLTLETENTPPERGPELAAFLAWHGIAAEVESPAPGGAGVGATILGRAGALGADLLVMGAYSHSRMRELILGGVTRHVLENATVPVLMAH